MEIFTARSSKTEDGVLPKQAPCHAKIPIGRDIAPMRKDESQEGNKRS